MCCSTGSREMRRSLMKRYSYRERDYAFGQLMLTLRMHIGLTQEGLAKRLHINRRAVAGWEAGSKRGEVRVWRQAGETLHLTWQEHRDIVLSLAFSPDEPTSGSLLRASAA